MYYQHAKHIGWRRYDDKVAIVGYLNGGFTLLGGPAASLWERLETPTSFADATRCFADIVGKSIPAQVLEKALTGLIDKGLLLSADSPASLASRYHEITSERGFYTDDLFGGFYREMQPYMQPNQMIKADVEVNNACNLRCAHCYITDYKDRDLMTLDEICGLFDELAEVGVLFLNITGGEMTLRRDFIDIIQAARDRHFVVSILSNATRLDEKALAGLRIASPANVYVSLYGVSEGMHEQITERAGSYAATMDNVRRLREIGVPVVLRYLIMRHNVSELQALPAFADAHDCLYTSSHNLFVIDGPKEFLGEHRITDEQRIDLWQKGLIKPPNKGLCTAGIQRVRIDAKGNVYPCELLRVDFGNVRGSSFVDIMSTQKVLGYIKDIHALPQSCGSCAKNGNCPRCPGLAHHEDGNLLGSSSKACRETDVYQRMNSPQRPVSLRVLSN